MAQTINYSIPAGKETLSCCVDYAVGRPDPTVICLHGGGPSGKHSTAYLGAVLQFLGKSVIRFDFSGHGESSGSLAESSLEKRFLEAQAVLRYFGVNGISSIIATSMGGHVACALANDVLVETLIFFGPAAYSAEAWDVPFGAGFTEIIRAENSFMDSDVVELLTGFEGRALYLIGEKDEIIPPQVVDLYHTALSHCPVFESYTIKECPHPIHRWVQKRPSIRERIEQDVVHVCLKGGDGFR